jgi:S-methylmethionine-dependent homocysteine/selenocysteine methylase
MMDWHRPRMKALVDAGVDLLAMETIPAQVK